MIWWQAVILGLVQGLGEFLPISSSAHLILVPHFFHFPDPGLSFDAVLHLGTLAAMIAYFWRDWIQIIAKGISLIVPALRSEGPGANRKSLPLTPALSHKGRGRKSDSLSHDMQYAISDKLFWWILVASIPGAIAGFLLESKAETVFRDPQIIAITLAGFGIVLWVAQKFAKDKKVNFWNSLWIGVAQALAVIPGVSRSGATMTTGMFFGLSKEQAARFSFLLATPIVLGAGLLSLRHIGSHFDINLLIGLVVSAVSGFFAIKFLLKLLQRANFTPFVVYRLLLAAAILLFLMLSK